MGFVLDGMNAAIEKHRLPTVNRIFSDNGIRHVDLEFPVDWHLPDARRPASDATFKRKLEIRVELGVEKIEIGGVFEEGELDTPAMRAALAKICERADPLTSDIVIELLPFASIIDVKRVLALFEGLCTTNGGLFELAERHTQELGHTKMVAAAVEGVPFSMRRGEVPGIGGLVGCGKG